MRLSKLGAGAVLAIGVALGLSACEQPAPNPTANDADLVDAAECAPADLSLAYVGRTETAEDSTTTYAFVNGGAKPCTMRGFPTLDFRTPGGTIEMVSVKHADLDAHRYPMRPKARLVFDVVSAKKGACVKGAHIRVSAPLDGSKPIDGKEGLDLCDNLKVTPVRREVPAK